MLAWDVPETENDVRKENYTFYGASKGTWGWEKKYERWRQKIYFSAFAFYHN